jgi:hypothetical protein
MGGYISPFRLVSMRPTPLRVLFVHSVEATARISRKRPVRYFLQASRRHVGVLVLVLLLILHAVLIEVAVMVRAVHFLDFALLILVQAFLLVHVLIVIQLIVRTFLPIIIEVLILVLLVRVILLLVVILTSLLGERQGGLGCRWMRQKAFGQADKEDQRECHNQNKHL